MNATPTSLHSARVLVVDDEDPVREGLCWSLRLSGYQVVEAASGAQALAILIGDGYIARGDGYIARGDRRSLAKDSGDTFDVMLLDMNMPAMGGVEVMEQARRRQPDLAIIVLTGHATLESAIAAVKAGASDYLLKPVSIQNLQGAVSRALEARAERLRQQRVVELMNEVAGVLHPAEAAHPPESVRQIADAAHPGEASAQNLHVGALALNIEKRLAVIDGPAPVTAELTEAEAAILQDLMRHPDQVRSCRQLVRSAWGYDMTEIEAAGMVRSHIFRLRKKLEADPANPQVVKTVRGGGYFLARG